MAKLSLKSIWGSSVKDDQKELRLNEGRRAYFRVTDPAVARRVQDWIVRRDEAEQAIGAYLRKASPLLGGETPFYKVDESGYVKSINFRYMMGFTHLGWKGQSIDSNWMVPEEGTEAGEKVRSELRMLPPLPSYSEINRLVGWPEAQINSMFQDMHVRGYEEFAERANRHVNISRSQGQIYISVPYPETFREYPKMEDAIAQWRPQEFMERIDDKLGRKIEKRFEFSRSPLGRTIGAALTKLAR
ncbi:MAG: hypothetical protein H6867_01720 [Rhodospirillales bacterium]|nr:hypothetical protein [Rhodospirillales bacterium]MCB9997236.1 hypothetical protein [Rhodospirillales bacterium]